MSGRGDTREWAARIAVGAVFLMNARCALQFILAPGRYTAGFQLAGVPGETAIRGLGIAFLMWNATYPLVIWRPRIFRTLFAVVIAQQLIGVAGETMLLTSLPAGHEVLAASIERFILFDAGGLLALVAGFLLTRSTRTEGHA
ncbi:MAG: hypothetical protein JXP37_04690 [Coriobacteriia bacterium]|nr:hypothetical protein [Coriobacteriia bacterium]